MIDIEILKSSLEGNGFISSVIYLDEVNSTNTYAKNKDIPIDSLIVTDLQSEGKGRLGRKWLTEKQSNLTFSIKKKLPLSPAENQFAVFYFSYYLYSAVKNYLSAALTSQETEELQIKWPNDILFNWKKLSGILIESVLPEGIYIIGIGLNCNQTGFPKEINAVSLKQITGNEIDLTNLLLNIIKEFSVHFSELENENFGYIYNNWKKSTKIIGKDCEFQINNEKAKYGKISDLNEDGSISIQYNDQIVNYFSGEVKLTGIK
ncbi:MAG: biotin--[acetyl-CoA-carboxylase] ligase [Ignavibacteria bacterium]